MTYEETLILKKINKKLAERGLKSRLSYVFVSGIREGYVTEWGFDKIIKEEAAEANILVSDEMRNLD
jgi:hypothetical protein